MRSQTEETLLKLGQVEVLQDQNRFVAQVDHQIRVTVQNY